MLVFPHVYVLELKQLFLKMRWQGTHLIEPRCPKQIVLVNSARVDTCFLMNQLVWDLVEGREGMSVWFGVPSEPSEPVGQDYRTVLGLN